MAKVDKIHVPKEGEVIPELGDEIPNYWLDRATAELKAGFRTAELLRNGELQKFTIAHPSVGQEMELSSIYTKKYNELFKQEGYMTRKELRKALVKRGTIDVEDDKRIEEINKSMKKVIEEINLLIVESEITPVSRVKKLKDKYFELRTELFELTHSQTEHFINCIENISEQLQTFHKMVMCVKKVDGTPVWESLEKLYEETDRIFVSNIITEASLYWSGLSREVLDDLPGVLESIHRGETLESLPEKDGS